MSHGLARAFRASAMKDRRASEAVPTSIVLYPTADAHRRRDARHCAWAQNSNTYFSGANQASSIVVSANQQAPRCPQPTHHFRGRPDGPVERTSLEMIAPQAQAHIDYALNLAERGAVQSAQAEFIIALDLIADALDADTRNATRAHARAVQAGLTAIEETKDFVPADTPHNVAINLAQLAATHQTPVLKNVDVTHMTRAELLQRYHSYATQQLAFAGGRSAIASSALYGLGRAECVTMAGASARNPLGRTQCYGSVSSRPIRRSAKLHGFERARRSHGALRRLGRCRWPTEHSVSIKPQVETWHNLATVYRRMGQTRKGRAGGTGERKTARCAAQPQSVGQKTRQFGDASQIAMGRCGYVCRFRTPYGLDGPAVSSNKSLSIAQRDSFGKRMIPNGILGRKPIGLNKTPTTTQLSQKADPSRSGEADRPVAFQVRM